MERNPRLSEKDNTSVRFCEHAVITLPHSLPCSRPLLKLPLGLQPWANFHTNFREKGNYKARAFSPQHSCLAASLYSRSGYTASTCAISRVSKDHTYLDWNRITEFSNQTQELNEGPQQHWICIDQKMSHQTVREIFRARISLLSLILQYPL